MASTPSQKWLTIFGQKLKTFYVSDHTVLFIHHHMLQILETFNVSISIYNINCKTKQFLQYICRLNFSVLPLQIQSLEVKSSLHRLFGTYVIHMLVKFERNRYGPKYTKL